MPAGRRVHESCVHHHPLGTNYDDKGRNLLAADGTVIEHYGPCAYVEHGHHGGVNPLSGAPFYQLWDGATAQSGVPCGNSGYPFYHVYYCQPWFNEFYGSLTVPANPNTADQSYEFNVWNGIVTQCPLPCPYFPGTFQPIIQPVVEWGLDGKNQGGPYWKVGLWFGDSYGVFQEWGITRVSQGDTIDMLAFVSDSSSCSFNGFLGGNGCTYTMQAYNSTFNNSVVLHTVSGIFTGYYRAVIENYWNAGTAHYYGVPCYVLPPGGAQWTNTWAWQPQGSATSTYYVQQNWSQGGNNDPQWGCSYQEAYQDQATVIQLF